MKKVNKKVRKATLKDYDENKTIHKYKAKRRKFKVSSVIGLCLIGIGIICTLLGFFFRNKFFESRPINYLYLNLTWLLGGGGSFLIIIGICIGGCGIKRIEHRIKKIGEDCKKIVDYLKTDNSGITQLKLASVLRIDRTKVKKCLNHLEWLGVVEKKKVSAEETLFFYKNDHEEDN